MAHLDYSTHFEQGHVGALARTLGLVLRDWIGARKQRFDTVNQQYQDRQAFNTLLGKEDWVLEDMGVHRGDVDYLSRTPLHVNAARELEKRRARNVHGR
jgi:uncharacterized protein YjiS (DUF1127 family)